MPFPWKSLRDWVADEEKGGEVLRIKAPIKCGDYNNIVDIGNGVPGKQPQTEIRAVVGYLHTLPGKPIGIIEHPVNNRPDIPVVVNPWPSRERTLRGIGLKTKDELCQKLQALKGSKIPPVTVSKKEAPCKEVIIPANKMDLRKDISRCWLEFNQFLWSACNATIIVYDAKSGTHDLGKLRTGQYEWKDADPANPYPEEWLKRYMCSTLNYAGAQRSNAGRYYFNHYRPTNKPMPAALALGIPTDMQMVASIKGSVRWPEEGDEYAAVGAFRGEPVSVVESETIPGLMVPADAEWIIEGEFLPELGDEILPRYAKDIASGYLSGGVACPILRVNCITHRKNPWWTDTTFSSSFSLSSAPGARSHEGPHTGLQFLTGEAEAINHLRGLGFMVKDVVMIGGGLEEAGEEFLSKVNLTIREWAFREATEDLKVIYSQLRENAVATGAGSLVTQKVFAGLL